MDEVLLRSQIARALAEALDDAMVQLEHAVTGDPNDIESARACLAALFRAAEHADWAGLPGDTDLDVQLARPLTFGELKEKLRTTPLAD